MDNITHKIEAHDTDTTDHHQAATPAATVYRIEIREERHNSRGPTYLVHFGDELLLPRAREPLFEACRILTARGLAGVVELWRPGAQAPSMRVDIEAGARLTVVDGSNGAPAFREWRPIDSDGDAS